MATQTPTVDVPQSFPAAMSDVEGLAAALAAKTANASAAITGGTITDTPSRNTFTSGEAVTAGYAAGAKNVGGVPKMFRASATSTSTPGSFSGVFASTVGAADLPVLVQSSGLSPVIPDAAWPHGVPAVTDVNAPVYQDTTTGCFTLSTSHFLTGDRTQPVGRVQVGGSGAVQIMIFPQAVTTELDPSLISGSDFDAGMCIGTATDGGVSKAYPVLARAGSLCNTMGIARTKPGAAGVQIHLQTGGVSDILPDDLWDAVPPVSPVDLPVYSSRLVSGHMTISLVNHIPTDIVQRIGFLAIGGTGACRLSISIGDPITKTQYDAFAALSGTNTGDQTVTGLGLDALTPGAALTNADVSIAPGTDKASEYTLPAATLTGNHTVTLATTGSPTTGLTVWIVRRDLTANTYAIINGGAGAGTLVTLPASPGKPMGACVYYDGTNWSLTAVVYIVA